MSNRTARLIMTFAVALAVAPLVGQTRQSPPAPTAADYARAEKFLAPALNGLVVGGSVTPVFIGRGGAIEDRFVYRTARPDGTSESIFVDPEKKIPIS